ncbi:MAG: CvpA family protein [Bacteroidota bacterium]|nr:CvpA family protein [Bacteroidota bacterium]
MNYLDYIIAGLLILGFILGYKDGLVRKIIGLIGIFLGIFLAVKLSPKLGQLISPLFDNEEYLAGIIAGIAVFIIVIIATTILKRVIHPHDKVSKFANQMLGGLTGVIQILFFTSGFFLFLNIFNVPNKKTADKALLYHPVAEVMPKTIDFMIGGKNIFREYIENKDKLKDGKNDQEEEQGNGKVQKNEAPAPENKAKDVKNGKKDSKEVKLKTKKHHKNV